MNRRIAMSAFSILSALALLGGGAFAAFTSQATATASTFTSGAESLTISLTGADGTFSPTVVSPFSGSNITPGYDHTFHVFLKNEGPDSLTITAKFANGSGDAALENVLMTDFSCTTGADPAAFNVTDMRAGQVNLGTLAPSASTDCSFRVTLPISVDNSAKNKSSVFEVLFDDTQ